MYSVVCFGDTNTWGYDEETGGRLPREKRWTGILADILGPKYYVIEEGLPGRTVVNEDPVERYKNGRDHLYACLESHRPIDVFVMMLGQVELKTRFSLTAYDIAMGIEELVQIILSSKAGQNGRPPKLLLISPVQVGVVKGTEMEKWFPADGTYERSAKLPALYREIANKYCVEFLEASSVAKTSIDAIHIANESNNDFAMGVAKIVTSMIENS